MTSLSAQAQIYEGLHTQTISTITQSHLFIENRMVGLEHSPVVQNNTRLMMLADMLNAGNSPPDFPSALKMAIKNADIITTTKDEIQIIQKDMLDREREIFDAAVEINNFTGRTGTLLHNLKLSKGTVELDQTFDLGGPIPELKKLDCKLTEFSFKGTLRDLLKTVAKKRDPLGGYVVMVGKDLKLSVKLIP